MFEIFNDIEFFEEDHKYVFKNRPELKPISVTGLVAQYGKSFDEEYWAKRKADDLGLTVEEIKAQWNYKRLLGTNYGTICHAYIENLFNKEPFEYPKKQICELFNGDPIYEKFNKTIPALQRMHDQLLSRLSLVKTELVVGDIDWNLTGTIDAIFQSKMNGKYYIFDWKTNKDYKTSSTYKLPSPLNHLDDCEHSKYSLQIGFYKAIIEKNADIKIDGGYTCWINDANPNVVINKTWDLTKEVSSILNNRTSK